LHHTTPNVWIQILQELLLLIDQVVRDSRAETPAFSRSVQGSRPAVLRISPLHDIPLLHQRRHDAARGALVEEQSIGECAEAQRAVLDQGFQRIALRDRNIVAADAVAISKLVHAHKIRDGRLEGDGVPLEWRIRVFLSSLRHGCY
jgi:hypothetical protein